jgi:DNA mismatch repair protein MutL
MTMTIPPEIRQLPTEVASRIAAGEVIERPAAVVKELVENSLDAGATRIVVTIEDGGRRSVQVEDDGHGMTREQLVLAVARHATSKLRDVADLDRITTLGFRGEALPSIAAVSEFALASRPAAVAGGWEIRSEGGDPGDPTPVAMAPGTRVTVRNLFWNVPARLKFLGSERAEAAAIKDMVIRLALGHPAVALALRAGDHVVIDLPAGQALPDRLRDCFGAAAADGLLPVHHEDDHLRLAGFVARAEAAAASARRQYVFLGGRAIHDKVVVAALREGFAGRLAPRLHPVAYLFLDLTPGMVDINVHPTKAEVRFRERSLVFTAIREAVAAALVQGDGAVALLPDSGITSRRVVKAALPRPEPLIQERFLPTTVPVAPPPVMPDPPPVMPGPPPATWSPPAAARAVDEVVAAYDPSVLPPGIRQIVQLADAWILVETGEGIRIIDQHALHEQALHLCLTGGFDGGGRQELLVPETVEVTAPEMAAIEPRLPALVAAGIEIEVFGPTTLLIRGFPVALRRTDWRTLLRSMLEEEGGGVDPAAHLRRRSAHRRACHRAIKAGERLPASELRELVALLYRVEGIGHCPHGRPTTLDLTWAELARRFQR